MKQRLLLLAFVAVVGVLTMVVHDRWGLPGAASMVALAVVVHALLVRRQRGLEGRLTDLLGRMSDDEIRAELATMAQPEREEVARALSEMGRDGV